MDAQQHAWCHLGRGAGGTDGGESGAAYASGGGCLVTCSFERSVAAHPRALALRWPPVARITSEGWRREWESWKLIPLNQTRTAVSAPTCCSGSSYRLSAIRRSCVWLNSSSFARDASHECVTRHQRDGRAVTPALNPYVNPAGLSLLVVELSRREARSWLPARVSLATAPLTELLGKPRQRCVFGPGIQASRYVSAYRIWRDELGPVGRATTASCHRRRT